MEDDEKKPSGCGLSIFYNSIFRRSAMPPIASPRHKSLGARSPRRHPTDSKHRRSVSDEAIIFTTDKESQVPVNLTSVVATGAAARRPGGGGGGYRKASGKPAAASRNAVRPRDIGLSGELDSMINDHQRSKGSSTLVRASSGNVMVFGNLGNIRAPGAVTPNRNVLGHLPQAAKEKADNADRKQRPRHNAGTPAAGYTPTRNGEAEAEAGPPEVLCRALSRRLEPEELKEMGNEEYRQGRYAEAVSFYDRAILIDPEKASYWSNKAAALMAMGELLEAVAECKEAVRIEPSYYKAHRRLATLYLRLGEPEKAIHYLKLARHEASAEDTAQCLRLQNHISKCREARKTRDWHSTLKEAESAVSCGADAAPQILAAHMEAFLALGRQEEAEEVFDSVPVFNIDASIKFFGTSTIASLLSVRALVHMASGRFEEAVPLAQRASQIEPSREVNAVSRKIRAAASARSTGNDLFKVGKFKEACVAYGEGLDHDPQNAILLCNRAACRSKLGQWEKAIEDCNAALSMRPSYTKARIRRADCNAKMGRWEASVQDYEALIHQLPGDEEVSRGLTEAQQQLKKRRGGGINGANLVDITNKDQLKQFINSPEMSVALIFNNVGELSNETIPSLEKMSRKYTQANFLKMDVGQNPSLKEYGDSDPVFLVYRNGSVVKEIGALDLRELEETLIESR